MPRDVSGKQFGQLFFESGSVGWSETFWLASASISAGITDLGELATARAAMLCYGTRIAYARSSIMGISGDANLGGGGSLPVATGSYDDVSDATPPLHATTALLLRFEDDKFRHTNHYLHQPPSTVIDKDGKYQLDVPFDAALSAYIVKLKELCKMIYFNSNTNATVNATILNIKPMRLVEKKVGRPSHLSVGRVAR